jgi:iron complex outermembrane receptor protein
MPQVAYNYEIGFKSSSDSLFYEISVFHIDLEDELIPFEIASSPGRTFYSNAGSSTRNGIEAAISWRSRNGLAADLSYTWSDFSFEEFVQAGEDFGGKQLPGLPEHFAYFGLSYAAGPGLSATLEALYSGDLYTSNDNSTAVDDYVVSNIRVSYEWLQGNWTVRPYVSVNNIFDKKYNSNIRINAVAGRYYEAAPEQNIYAGVVVGFGK